MHSYYENNKYSSANLTFPPAEMEPLFLSVNPCAPVFLKVASRSQMLAGSSTRVKILGLILPPDD